MKIMMGKPRKKPFKKNGKKFSIPSNGQLL